MALLILSVGLLALSGLYLTSIKGNFFSRELTQATYIAQDRLEFLKNLPLTSNFLLSGNYNDGTVTFSGIVFDRSYTVAINNNLRTITYTITWNDGRNHNISISTIRSQ